MYKEGNHERDNLIIVGRRVYSDTPPHPFLPSNLKLKPSGYVMSKVRIRNSTTRNALARSEGQTAHPDYPDRTNLKRLLGALAQSCRERLKLEFRATLT